MHIPCGRMVPWLYLDTMADHTALAASFKPRPPSVREWKIGAVIFVSYVVTEVLTFIYVPTLALHPGFAIALGAAFFGGVRVLPPILVAAIGIAIITNASAWAVVATTLGAVIPAGIGARALQQWNVDPIFRRDHDVLRLVAIVAAISFIPPIASLPARVLSGTLQIEPTFVQEYVSTLFCFLILTPLILRWYAKPRFRRRPLEITETMGVFLAVAAASIAHFLFDQEAVYGIPLTYLLLAPLTWIALRLRPRFVTLALLFIALIATISFAIDTGPDAAARAFEIELFLIGTAIFLLIITSLEEHRRANANRFYAQMATLQNVLARVNSESQAKNDFIAILAHELRNPLAPVVSGIEWLQLKKERDPAEVATLASMARSLETVRALLNDLLDVSRISEGKIALQKEDIDLDALLARAALSTEHHRKERHQALRISVSSAGLRMHGDPVRLEQVVSNLLTNASKYSNSGDAIALNVREDGDVIEIEVADEGIGLESDALERIFQPFEQIPHGERSRSGLGLGLALVHDFVRMHGGIVHAESSGRGKGSQFIVKIPRTDPDAV